MIAVYGTMLDTPVVGLPFGIAVLLLWQRARSGHPTPVGLVAAVTALAVLSSWRRRGRPPTACRAPCRCAAQSSGKA